VFRGIKSAQVYARRFQNLTMEHLKKIGVSVNRAKYFISVRMTFKIQNPEFKGNYSGDMEIKFENRLIINYHYSITFFDNTLKVGWVLKRINIRT
jgi:hypothetical protein